MAGWRPVVGYEGLYEVSDEGQVRSLYTGRILAPNRTYANGRLKARMVRLCRDKVPSTFAVHRLVLEAFVGFRPDGKVCCHNDGDPSNNRLENLRWDTQAANIADAIRHGTHPTGEANGKARLTEQQVMAIRASSETNSAWAKRLGVSKATVSHARTGRNWAWL